MTFPDFKWNHSNVHNIDLTEKAIYTQTCGTNYTEHLKPPLHIWLAILTSFCIQFEIDFTYNLQIFLLCISSLRGNLIPGCLLRV